MKYIGETLIVGVSDTIFIYPKDEPTKKFSNFSWYNNYTQM
jgi:hypothetical protein